MTYGLVMTLGVTASGFYSAFYHWLVIAAGLAMPVLAYVVFRLADPVLFQAELY